VVALPATTSCSAHVHPTGPSFVFTSSYRDHRDLHSFPTRRSSDLCWSSHSRLAPIRTHCTASRPIPRRGRTGSGRCTGCLTNWRSEEHTSELQSRENLVCRLLLEKKKTPRKTLHSDGQQHDAKKDW